MQRGAGILYVSVLTQSGFSLQTFFLKRSLERKKKYFLEFFLNWRSTSRGCIRFSPSNVVRSLWGVSSLFGVKTRVMCNRRWGGGDADDAEGPLIITVLLFVIIIIMHSTYLLKLNPKVFCFFSFFIRNCIFMGIFDCNDFPYFFSFYY